MAIFNSTAHCEKGVGVDATSEYAPGKNNAHRRPLVASGFMLLLGYYLLRPVREALLLNTFDAEVRSYAVGGLALIILLLVQPYSRWLKSCSLDRVFSTILIAGILMLLGFSVLGASGFSIQVPFFIWLGLFSLLIIAQFWAAAARCVNSESAKRFFPMIAVGLSLGAITGSLIASLTYASLGPYGIMALAAPFLAAHLAIQSHVLRGLSPNCKADSATSARPPFVRTKNTLCGLSLVAKSGYLSGIALLVVLLNCMDTTGDYILASSVQAHVLGRPDLAAASDGALLGTIFADYFFWSCVIGLGLQVFVVPRLFRKLDIGGALHILPMVIFIGYSLISFVPIFSLVYVVKILETATNYAINGTARHTLMVPLDPVSSCQGKTIIDTFFWRCGDLMHALMLYTGIHWLGLDAAHFVALNVVMAAVCLLLVRRIGSEYRLRVKQPPAAIRQTSTLCHDAATRFEAVNHSASGRGGPDWLRESSTGLQRQSIAASAFGGTLAKRDNDSLRADSWVTDPVAHLSASPDRLFGANRPPA